MGLYKRGKNWTICYMVNGKQKCESTGTTNRRLAQRILDKRKGEIAEGRFQLPRSNAPRFETFSREFLDSIRHPNTKKRYASSIGQLKECFGDIRLSDLNAQRIENFKSERLADNVRGATINRDLAVLRRMLRIAERRRFIMVSPFLEMLEERKERRQPHILTFAEEEKLLAVSPEHIRVLAILLLETGMRSGKEALALRWEDVDFTNELIRVRESKTQAGIRTVPMSGRCKAELLRWNSLSGPEFSEYVFANPRQTDNHLKNVRRAWPKVLKDAGLVNFWLYDLRHTFASRLTEAGVSPIFVAQLMGHSSANILQTYAKAVDEYRRSAISKLESLRRTGPSEPTAIRLARQSSSISRILCRSVVRVPL
jgi:integrase